MNNNLVKNETHANHNLLATARWGEPKYMAQHYPYKPGSFWLGRNPHNPHQALGFEGEGHIFLAAGSRSGKGRSIIINNLIKWQGSIVSIDPKGLNATITAARRGQGNEFCEGMGQNVYVLDPMNCANVPDELRAHYNLMDALDPDDGNLSAYADMIADAICVMPEGGDAAEWALEGKEFVSIIIQWVVCAPHIAYKDRNLLTVRNLIMEGEYDRSEKLKQQKIIVDPYAILLDDMENSTVNKGRIARQARDWKQSVKDLKKYFESIRKSAIRHLKFLNTDGMENTLSDTGVYPRTFNLSDLRDSSTGVSLYLCLPPQHANPYGRWQRAMINLILYEMQKSFTKPKIGSLLLSIDEFPLLGRMDSIIENMNYIGESGVKLFLACQQIVNLKEIYQDNFEQFIAGSALQIWFATGGKVTGEYLSQMLGETEVVKYQRNINTGQSVTDSLGTSTTHSSTTSSSKGNSESLSTSESNSEGKSTTWNESENWSKTQGWNKAYSNHNSSNWGESKGKNAGKNYGPGLFHIFADGSNRVKNSGSSEGGSSGSSDSQGSSGSDTQSGGHNRGGGTTESSTHTTGENKTQSTGSAESQSVATAEQKSRATGHSISAGMTETFHKKPLLTVHESESYFKAITDKDHDAFPGLALIKIQGELPFFVRKINYDQDKEFEHCFNPHPSHDYTPYSLLPLLEYEYTQDYYIPITLPEEFRNLGYTLTVNKSLKQGIKLKRGDLLFRMESPFSETIIPVSSAHDVEIIHLFSDDYKSKTGQAMIIRHHQKLGNPKVELEEFKQRFQTELWQPLIDWMQAELAVVNSIKQKKAIEREKQEELERQRQEEKARKKQEEKRLRQQEKIKQKQIKLSGQKRKQDEFEEKRQQAWLGFLREEAEYEKKFLKYISNNSIEHGAFSLILVSIMTLGFTLILLWLKQTVSKQEKKELDHLSQTMGLCHFMWVFKCQFST